MSQEFGEISFGQFWGGICHKVMVRCQGTLQSLEGLTGCDMQDADLGCWQLVLAAEWNPSWDHQPEPLQWPLHITWAFVQPDLEGGGGQNSSVVRGQESKVGARMLYVIIRGIGSITLATFYWLWASHRRPAQCQRQGRQTLPLHRSRVKESIGMF